MQRNVGILTALQQTVAPLGFVEKHTHKNTRPLYNGNSKVLGGRLRESQFLFFSLFSFSFPSKPNREEKRAKRASFTSASLEMARASDKRRKSQRY